MVWVAENPCLDQISSMSFSFNGGRYEFILGQSVWYARLPFSSSVIELVKLPDALLNGRSSDCVANADHGSIKLLFTTARVHRNFMSN